MHRESSSRIGEGELDTEHRTFLRLLKPMARLALDAQQDIGHAHDHDRESLRFRLTEEEFIEHLYQERPEAENAILNQLQTRPDLLCFIGESGAGKTSVARKLRYVLNRRKLYNFFVCYIDARLAIRGNEHLVHGSSEEFLVFLRRLIREHYIDSLFRNHETSLSPARGLADLYAYLLDPGRDPGRPENLFFSLFSLQDEADDLFRSYVDNPTNAYSSREDFSEWLLREAPANREIRTIKATLRRLLDVHHLVYAARSLHGFDLQVIWLDNVDGLPHRQQRALFRHAKLFHNRVADYACTVISLRDESVKDFESDEDGAPARTSRVLLQPNKKGGYISYPSYEIPALDSRSLRRIIMRRLEATRVLQLKRLAELRTLDYRLRDDLAAAPNSEREIIIRKITELRAELEFYGPAISRERYDELVRLSMKLVSTIAKEGAVYLANHSIRDVISIFRDCLAHLLRFGTDGDGRLFALGFEDWYITTVFLSWIRITERDFRVEVPDIFESLHRWRQTGMTGVGCQLSYVTINAIRNLEEEKRTVSRVHRFPAVREVVARVARLGYSENEIVEAIYQQIQHRNVDFRLRSGGGARQVYDDEDNILRIEALGVDDEVFVRPRGKCITAVTAGSFGYIYECLARHRYEGDRAPEEIPKRVSTSLALEGMIESLRAVADMHIEQLRRYRDTREVIDRNWLREYRLHFGTLLHPPYTRSASGGGVIAEGYRRALQFELLANSLLLYIPKYLGDSVGLRELITDYNRRIEALARLEGA